MKETAELTEEQRWRAWVKQGKEREKRNQRRLGIAAISVLLLAGVAFVLFNILSSR